MQRRFSIEAWLKKLDRQPTAFPATVAALCGFGTAATLLTQATLPRAAALGTLAALGGAVARWARSGQAQLEIDEPSPIAPPLPPYPERPHPITPADLWIDVPAGTFLMGSPEGVGGADERPQHEVTLSAFRMMRVPVTRGLYREIVGQDPGWPEEGEELDQLPVNNVSWYDALHFCNELSKREGGEPVYSTADGRTGPFAKGTEVVWSRNARGYSLPTEAQWEYACRAGSQTAYCFFGDDEAELVDYGWYGVNFDSRLHPVGRKLANAWGLHDLHGNVWEWCWDSYAPYTGKSQIDPAGPAKPWLLRPVVRGGSYLDGAWWLRSAYRNWDGPVLRYRFLGFRCVLVSRPVLGPSAF